MRTWFYGETLKETDSLEASVRWDDNIKTNLKNTVGGLGWD